MRIEEWNINNNDQGGRKQIFYGWATVNSEKLIFKKLPFTTK